MPQVYPGGTVRPPTVVYRHVPVRRLNAFVTSVGTSVLQILGPNEDRTGAAIFNNGTQDMKIGGIDMAAGEFAILPAGGIINLQFIGPLWAVCAANSTVASVFEESI